MHLTIGLDISTSCTGICALDERGSLVSLTHIKYPSKLSLWEKADLTRSELKKLIAQTDGTFKRFFVEESLQKFRPGLSSAKTLTTLSKFNGIVSYLGREVFKIDPEAIRKSVGLKIPRGSNAKEVVLEWVSQEMNFHWPTKILKSGPRKGQEVLIDPCYDMADAYLIARAGQTFVNQVK
jgi:hypothetical protein